MIYYTDQADYEKSVTSDVLADALGYSIDYNLHRGYSC